MSKLPLMIRVEKQDLEAWQGAAIKVGLSLSEWVRRQCNLMEAAKDVFEKVVMGARQDLGTQDTETVRRVADVPVEERSIAESAVLEGGGVSDELLTDGMLEKLIAELRERADDFAVTCGDSEVEHAYNWCAARLELILAKRKSDAHSG